MHPHRLSLRPTPACVLCKYLEYIIDYDIIYQCKFLKNFISCNPHELRKKLVRCYGLEHCFILLRDLDSKNIGVEVFWELWNVVLEENGEDKVFRKVLECIREKRMLLNNILCKKANWIGHILRKNCLLHYEIEGKTTEMKGVRRKMQLLDDLRNRIY